MPRTTARAFGLTAALAALGLLLALHLNAGPGQTRLTPSQDLGSAELRKYQGRKLTDFRKLRDNSIDGPQRADTAAYRLEVAGLVKRRLSLRYTQVLGFKRYQRLMVLPCVEGWSATGLFEGVLVGDLLDSAGVLPEATILVLRALDGYTTSLPLAAVWERQMLLAFRVNNAALDERNGFPFQLAAGDKLGYKWIKWVDRIEASSDSAYRGFWEQRGYDNDAEAR